MSSTKAGWSSPPLLLADFDPDVVAIAAQPFLLRAAVGGRIRRHVPDSLLVHAGQSARVVNVKPASRLADPQVVEALARPGRGVWTRSPA